MMTLIILKSTQFVSILLLVGTAQAFLPSAQRPVSRCNLQSGKTSLSLAIDPSHFVDAIQQFTSATSTLLSDAVPDADTIAAATSAVSDTVATVGNAAASMAVDTASAVSDTAATAAEAAPDYGWFGFLTVPIEGLLQIIHSLIAGTGTANAWGVSIIVLTLLIKAVTFPLTKTQLESTNKMQAMQPAIKEIQLKYQSNPEVMNQKIAEFYQVNEINPLAGCLPSLVQIPVFIGLYRAVLELAKQDKLNEQFLFLPNLEGPTYGADPAAASDWILKGWYVERRQVFLNDYDPFPKSNLFIVSRVDGTPSLGWDDTLAFLVLPAFLVISQFVSMELMQPKSTDPQQQQSNAILKVLPLMIGWFSLSVPAALSVYWVTNNIVTTASTLWIRSMMPPPVPKTGAASGGTSAATMSTTATPQSIFTPIRDKPAGFGEQRTVSSKINADGVKPITVMDAEMVDDDDMEDDDDDEEHDNNDSSRQTTEIKKKRRKGSKKKGK